MKTPLPTGRTCLGIHAGEHAADTLGEDRPGCRIGGYATPANTLSWHIGEVDVENVLPEFLTRHGIEADDLFRLGTRARGMADQRVESAIDDDWRRNA